MNELKCNCGIKDDLEQEFGGPINDAFIYESCPIHDNHKLISEVLNVSNKD